MMGLIHPRLQVWDWRHKLLPLVAVPSGKLVHLWMMPIMANPVIDLLVKRPLYLDDLNMMGEFVCNYIKTTWNMLGPEHNLPLICTMKGASIRTQRSHTTILVYVGNNCGGVCGDEMVLSQQRNSNFFRANKTTFRSKKIYNVYRDLKNIFKGILGLTQKNIGFLNFLFPDI